MTNDFMFEDPAVRNALGRIKMSDWVENGVEIPMLPKEMVLAMSYMPMQVFKDMYPVAEGFCEGTIFPELNKPFLGGKCK